MLTPQKYSDIFLDLYRGAQTHQVTEFPSFAIDTIKKYVDFDMAMFGLMSRASDGKVAAHYGTNKSIFITKFTSVFKKGLSI